MMQFSLFTPTHDTSYLDELFESIKAQTYSEWEWIIVPNGDVIIPDTIKNNTQIKIIPAPQTLKGVGALKKFACQQCTGDYLVEVDHDDLLASDALETIHQFIQQTNADFLYSDSAIIRYDGRSPFFDSEYGWEYYIAEIDGKEYVVNESFDETPSSLGSIHFAPNHVRVWKKSVYDAIGGHDTTLDICDDYDLICRTYIAGYSFVYIPLPIYIYRIWDDVKNTYKKRQLDIDIMQKKLSQHYRYALIDEWCRRNQLPMIDLGGAHNAPDHYQTIDLVDADITMNIMDGLPFEDNSVGCIRAYDFLEHIPSCQDSSCKHQDNGKILCTVGLMNEVYRVLVAGGWFITSTPSSDGRGAYQDPSHISYWNPNSFWYFTDKNYSKYIKNSSCRFQAYDVYQHFPTYFHKQHNIPYVVADLVALKGQRQPDLTFI